MPPSETSTGTRGSNPIDLPPLPVEEESDNDPEYRKITETMIRDIIITFSTAGIQRVLSDYGDWCVVIRRMVLFIKKIDDLNHIILDELQGPEIHPDLKIRIESGYARRWVRHQYQLKKIERAIVAEDARVRLFIDSLQLSAGRRAFQRSYLSETGRFGHRWSGGIRALAVFAYKKTPSVTKEPWMGL